MAAKLRFLFQTTKKQVELNFEHWTLKFEVWTLWYVPLLTTSFANYANALSFELWTLNFELWGLNFELYNMGSWQVYELTSWQVNCSDKPQLTVVIIIMNCEFWIISVIIIMNCEL